MFNEKYKNELPQIMLDFLDYCRSASQRKSEHTVINYALDLKKWFQYQFKGNLSITAEDIGKLELIDLDKFVGSLNNMSSNTVIRNVASIKSFYRYLIKYKMIRYNIAIDIDTPKKQKRSPKYLTVKEITKLISMPEKMGARYKERDKAILIMFIGTGLRLSELVDVNKSDIKEGMLRVVGKGDKERFIPLSDKVQQAIKDYLKVRMNYDGDTLFVTERNTKFNAVAMTHLVKKYLEKAKLNEYSTHKLRHTAATEWYENGTDIKEIQELLGHESIETTLRYTHGNRDKKKVVNNVRW